MKNATRMMLAAALALGAGCKAENPEDRADVSRPEAPPRQTSKDRAELRRIMKDTLNASFTEMSFWLFHNEDAPVDQKFDVIGKVAARLKEGARAIRPLHPPKHVDQLADYVEFSVQLRYQAIGLQESALERNLKDTVLWFSMIKNTCSSCHRVYRFAQDSPMLAEVTR